MSTTPVTPGPEHLPRAIADNVGFLLARLGAISGSAFSEALEPMGLRPRHYAVLSALVEHPELSTQHGVGGCLAIDPSTMVAVADELERRGLVSRRRDPADRRRYCLSVTPSGQQEHDACRAVAAHVEAELLDGLDEDDRSALRHLLQQVLELGRADRSRGRERSGGRDGGRRTRHPLHTQ